MSKVTDEKVVQIQFDNQQFEKNVKTSIDSIDNLKKSLKFDDSEKSLKTLEDTASKVSFTKLGESIDSVKVKFSALETMAVTALANITSKAVDTGIELVRNLSVDNIAAGWQKYEDTTSAVGTLISQGFDMSTVQEQMDKLNWYTDETSYNFVDMVSNIGKFTASGVALEDAMVAMEGIANWAALSGQRAQTASRAMYQLAQAIGRPMQKLDWISVMNANMDNAEFRIKALETAVRYGTLEIQEMSSEAFLDTMAQMKAEKKSILDIKSFLESVTFNPTQGTSKAESFNYGGFIDSITNGRWITPEVQIDLYKQYGAAIDQIYTYATEKGITASEAMEELNGQIDEFGLKAFLAAQEARTWTDTVDSVKDAVSTGWMKTFELIFGNYEEAKVLWTNLANSLWDVFAGPISERNEMLAEWKELGGRDDIIDAFWNIFGNYDEVEKKYTGLVGLIQIVKEAFQEIFPPKTAEDFKKITERIRDWTERFKFSEDQVNNFRDAIKGILSIFKVLGQVIKALLSPFKLLKDTGGSLIDVLISITGWIGRLLSGFANWLSDNDILVNAVKGLMGIIGGAIKLIELLFTKITGLTFKQFGEKIKNAFGSLSDFLKGVGDKIKDFFSGIGDIDIKAELGNFAKGFGEGVQNGFGKVVGVFDKVKNAVGKFFDKVKEVFSKLPKIDFTGADTFSEKVKRVFEPVKTLFEKLKDGIEWVWGIIKKVFGKVKEIFTAVVSFVKDIFGKATDEVNKIDWNKVSSVIKTIFEIIKGFISLGILKNINGLIKSTKGLVDGIKHIGDTFSATLKQIADAFDGIKKKVKSEQVKDIAESILMVAAAMFILALLPEEKLKAAGIALGIATTALIGVFIGMDKATKHSSSKRLYTLTTAMLKLAEAIAVIAIAIRLIGNLDPAKVAVAAVTLSLTLGALSGAVVGLDKATKGDTSTRITKLAETIVILSAALAIISASIKHIAKLDPLKVAISAGVLVLVLGSLIGTVIALDKATKGSQSPRIMKLAETIVILSAAMAILSASIKHIAKLDTKGVVVATVALVTMLTALLGVIRLMPKDKDLTKSSGALLALAGAVAIISVAMRILAKLSWDELGRSVVAFAAILTGLVIAMNAVQATSLKGALGMLIIAAAMAVMVPVLLSFGLMPWPVIGKGLLTLAGVLVTFVAAAYALTPVVGTLVAFGAAMLMLGGSVLAFATGVAVLAVAIPLFATNMAIFGDLVIDGIIKIIEAIPRMISAFVLSIIQSAEDIVTGLVELIRIVLQAITTLLPEIVSMLVNMLLNIIKATITALADHAYEIVSEFVRLIKEILRAIVDAFKDVSFDEIVEVVLALVGALGVLGLLVPVIATAVLITSMLPIIGLNLSAFAASIIPFLAILSKVDPKTLESAKLLADTVLEFTAASLIDGIASWITGGSDYTKFAEQLGIIGTGLNNFSNNTKDVDVDKVKTAAEATKILADVATNLPYQSNSLAGWIAGKVTLSDFAKQMEDFAEPFNKFVEGIEGVDVDLVQVAVVCAATTVMADLAKDLPQQGNGLISWIVGSKMTLTDFAQELEWFAPHFNEFIKKISNTNVNLQKVQIVSLATKIMTSVANNLPHQGNGLLSWIVGSKMTLTDFAQEMEWFAPHFKTFVQTINPVSISIDKIKTVAEASTEMVKVVNELPSKNNGIISWFTGSTLSLTDFGLQMETFAVPFKGFANTISNTAFDIEKIETVAKATTAMATVANELPQQSNGVVSWFVGSQMSLTDFAQEMEWFAPHFSEFAKSIDGITVDSDALDTIISGTLSMVSLANQMPEYKGFVSSWFGDNKVTLTGFAADMEGFAGPFKQFNECLSVMGAVRSKKVEDVVTASIKMAELANQLPDQTGFIVKWLGLDNNKVTLSAFGAEMALFAPHFKDFINTIGVIDAIKIYKATAASNALPNIGALLQNLPYSEGKINQWIGEKNLSKFGDELGLFAPKYRDFIKSISELTDEEIGKATAIAPTFDSLAALMEALPEEKSDWLKFWTGEQISLSKFGEQLETFGSHYKTFCWDLKQANTYLGTDVKVESVTEFLKETVALMDLVAESYSNYNANDYEYGLMMFDKYFEDLSGAIASFFGYFASNYYYTDEKVEILRKIVEQAKTLIGIYTDFASVETGDTQTTKFLQATSALNTFLLRIEAMMTAYKNGSEGLDQTTIDNFFAFLTDLTNIAKEITAIDSDSVKAFFTSLTNIPNQAIFEMMKEVQDAMPDTRTKIKEFLDIFEDEAEKANPGITKAFTDIIDSFFTKYNLLKTPLYNLGRNIIRRIQNGINIKQEDLKTSVKDTMQAAYDTAKSSITDEQWSSIGEYIVNKTKDYFNESKSTLADTIWDVISAAIENVNSDEHTTEVAKTGENVVNGLIKGIQAKTDDLVKTTEDLADNIPKALRNTLEIKSPSRVAERIGSYVGEGLVISLRSYNDRVYVTSSDLGTAAERGLAEAMNRIQDVIMSDPDDTLTIRPVLDLSEIQNGTKRLYSMMPNFDSFSIYGDYGMAEEIAGRVRSAEIAKNVDLDGTINNDTSDKNNPNTTFNNTFNIQGDDPRAIATEVSRIIQRQTERKEAVWGS